MRQRQALVPARAAGALTGLASMRCTCHWSSTALAEYQQLDALLPPGLMVSYNLSIDSIVDFRGGFTSDWDALWQDFYCDWRNMRFNQGIEPPSWVIGDQVLAAGAKGIVFGSAIIGGANLVIYTDALTGVDSVNAYDPNSDLPKNQSSW